jgi:diguanylate cyclase (GGDEF)-like protein
MDPPTTRLLLVMRDPGEAARVQAALAGVRDRRVDAVPAGRLDEALGILAAVEVDLALVDLALVDLAPADTDLDGSRRTAYRAVQEQVPELPVIVLHRPGEDAAGLQAVGEGAADHLSTGHLDPELVGRAIRYAIERQQLLGDLRRLALVDDTTRIANRRGFVAMSEGLANLARRTGLTVTVLYLDVDGLGEINQAFGQPEGDRALRAVAKLLRGAFRASDVIARLGGDEFGVLLLHDGSGDGPAVRRLEQALYFATVREADLHARVRPVLREVAELRLAARQGISLDGDRAAAAAALGPELWELVRADRRPPADRTAPGASPASLRAMLDRLEAI